MSESLIKKTDIHHCGMCYAMVARGEKPIPDCIFCKHVVYFESRIQEENIPNEAT